MFQCFTLSIEWADGTTSLYPNHLGTDELTARRCAISIFSCYTGLDRKDPAKRTVALKRQGSQTDYFDGEEWSSDRAMRTFESMLAEAGLRL